MIEGSVILSGDFKALCPKWNLHCGERRDAAGLETQIERYGMILKNKLRTTSRPT